MTILISAYACSPSEGSEPGMVWKVVSNVSQHHKVFVICDDENKEEIYKAIKENNLTNLHFVFNPVPEKVRQMCNNQGDWRFYYYYRKWQKKSLEIAKSIIKENSVDVVHQLGMITFREPGYLIRLGKPFVWGPIGGMNKTPVRYLKGVSLPVRIKYYVKNCLSTFQYLYVPRIVKTINNADVLIAANSSAYRVLTTVHKRDVYKINETGCESDILHLDKLSHQDSFSILWVGRFLPTKLLNFSLEVISQLKELPGLRLHIIGAAFDDKDTQYYKDYAVKLGISDICEWHGWVSHDDVQHLMQQSDVMFFPSVVEGTPHVILESVANNLPVVCFDACGQADIIDDSIGVKLPLTNYIQSRDDFERTLRTLYNDRSKLQSFSDNCNKRKKSLSWDYKIDQYLQIYKNLVEKKLIL
jgi:glycosyltransferase involved in cell wall biosynthesis